MLCADIMRQADTISNAEWNYFLRGAAGVDKVIQMHVNVYTRNTEFTLFS